MENGTFDDKNEIFLKQMSYQLIYSFSVRDVIIGMSILSFFFLLSCNEAAFTKKNVEQLFSTNFNTPYLNQLHELFGEKWTKELIGYNLKMDTISSSVSLEIVYKEAQLLRDSLLKIIEQKLEKQDTQALPDLFWLKEVLPNFVPQLVAEGTRYYLFNDYGAWLQRSLQTPEPEDDLFMELCISLYPDDSIAYFFPVWFIQTWDYGGHSLLGRKHHRGILSQINAIWGDTAFLAFRAEVFQIKNDIISDIIAPKTTYWEKKEAIIAELDRIIESNYAILNENDKIALRKRRLMFEQAEQNGIQLNQQSGI